LEKEVTHRYSANSFKLHRLPVPRPGQVLGLVGTNGIGKSTALKVLAGKMKPNLGNFDNPPDWQDILKYFRGSELQNYFTKILEDNLKVGSLLLILQSAAWHSTAQHSTAGLGWAGLDWAEFQQAECSKLITLFLLLLRLSSSHSMSITFPRLLVAKLVLC
jgi:ATPase subunit of ABC transporter with duplicated ATPase domains